MKAIWIKVLAIFFLLCFGCVDEVDINVDTRQRTVVVDGVVTDSMGDFLLNLSESSVIGIGNDNILDPIPGATVKLIDKAGSEYNYEELENGEYVLRSFKAERGKSYFIDIRLPDGRHYQSIPDSLHSSSKIDEISYEVNEESYRDNAGEFVVEEVLSVFIATDVSDAATKPYLRWRISGEYTLQEGYPGALNPRKCYIKNTLDLNDIRIFDTSELGGDELFGQVIAQTSYDFRFGEQYCFHISQYSISEAEYEYWRNIKEIIEIEGGLFDPPPGTIVGNIFNVNDPDDVAVGYFSVSSIYFVRDFVNSDDLDFFVRPKCLGFFREIPFGCMNCLDLNNSSLVRPPYWEF